VKAFDTVPRAALFKILRKFGLPAHMVNIIIRLHTDATMNFLAGDIEAVVDSLIGVRQGSIEGPPLFIFIMQAALETMEWPVDKPTFCTRADEKGEMNGVRPGTKRGVERFNIWASLFADDCACLFNTRADLVTGANYMYHHFRRFGLLIHVGTESTKSKTEAMYLPARGDTQESGDTSNFVMGPGHAHFTDNFKYLGNIISSDLTSELDIKKRVGAMTGAFAALKRDIFKNRRICLKTRGKFFAALCLPILLFGCECWCLTEKLFSMISTAFRKAVRMMCGVRWGQVIKHRITTNSLLERLGLKPIRQYIDSRILRWTGHVARMPWRRLPRKLITSWVDHKRPRGRPPTSYVIAYTTQGALKRNGLPVRYSEFSPIAQDRAVWRRHVHGVPAATAPPAAATAARPLPLSAAHVNHTGNTDQSSFFNNGGWVHTQQ